MPTESADDPSNLIKVSRLGKGSKKFVIIQGKNRPVMRSAPPARPSTWTQRAVERGDIEQPPCRQEEKDFLSRV
ncbi:hypothetical protein ccbrp13_16430 [Ktedonobacteria bacterium brp13]|nr:hypothetical protein ccbrp13_16430 [Ktedonobacteria bacterium brp13]